MPTNKRNVNAEGLAAILPTIQIAATLPSSAPAIQRGLKMFASGSRLPRFPAPVLRDRPEARVRSRSSHGPTAGVLELAGEAGISNFEQEKMYATVAEAAWVRCGRRGGSSR